MQFKIHPLLPDRVTDLYLVYQAAFKDYPIRAKMTLEQFKSTFIYEGHLDFQLSAACYTSDDYLVGFIMMTAMCYENHTMVYNLCTAVRPDFRGNDLTRMMYDKLLPHYRQQGYHTCYLEVLKENLPARMLFESIGYGTNRHILTYKSIIKQAEEYDARSFKFHWQTEPNWKEYKEMLDQPMSVRARLFSLEKPDKRSYLELRIGEKLVGVCVLVVKTGKVMLFAIDRNFRRKGFGKILLQGAFKEIQVDHLYFMNVDKSNSSLNKFLTSQGFQVFIEQFEMELNLT